jgi:hypothetical protein
MAYYTYSNTTGNLVEISDFPLAAIDDLAAGFVEELTKAELETYHWDTNVREFMNTPRRVFTKREIIRRFTPQEFLAIKNSSLTDPDVDYNWQMLMLTDYVDLNDTDTVNAMNAFVLANLITEQRKQEILL